MWSKSLFHGLIVLFSFASFIAPSFGKEMTGESQVKHIQYKIDKTGHSTDSKSSGTPNAITIFMTGDVMTGRGIDQVLPHPSAPQIYEPYVRDARAYVELAEKANGPIKQPVDWSYIWGYALNELERVKPDLRIINLETAVTKSEEYWKGKGINYRMHPENIQAITPAGIDVAVLGNNHVLDWGYSGLQETLKTLKEAGIRYAGAGRNLKEAEAPAMNEVEGKGRVIVFSFGSETSGIPSSWSASKDKPGVKLLKELSDKSLRQIKDSVVKVKGEGDVVIASIHWGGNWGYHIPDYQREFARKLIDVAGIDVIHGHSSHHVKGIEVYGGKLILYGCGDFLTDYEGISGQEEFRDDLGLMYFASVDPSTGKLVQLQMAPTQMKNFSLQRVSRADALWLRDTLNREGKIFGTRVELNKEKNLTLQWD
jgi:poly-gamma-glutamate synthesis protein (capsule biosynthesis protein)